MKTIQEYLKECNREEIINKYMYEYGFTSELMNDYYRDITVGEIKSNIKSNLNKLIDRLINITPKPNGEWHLLAVHVPYKVLPDDIDYILIKGEDLSKETKNITGYSYVLSPQEECVAFMVADTYLTQCFINDLLVDFLHEVSFMGIEQERREKILDSLKRAKDEVDEGKTIPFEEFVNELREDYGWELEQEDPVQKEAYDKWQEHNIEYATICRQLEIDKLKECVLKEGK